MRYSIKGDNYKWKEWFIFRTKLDHIHPSVGYRFKHFNVKAGYGLSKKGDDFFSFGISFGGRKKSLNLLGNYIEMGRKAKSLLCAP